VGGAGGRGAYNLAKPKGMIKQLVFIVNYDINFLLSLLKWLFLVHESNFLCFNCS